MRDVAEQLDEAMDAYGWASKEFDADARQKALLRWMQRVTDVLVTLHNRGDAADELEAKLIEKGVL